MTDTTSGQNATYRRTRVLFGDQLNIARGKYVPSHAAEKGLVHVSLATYGATYSRKLVPVPGAGFFDGLPDVDVVFDPDERRPGWEPNTDVVLASLERDGRPADLCARSALAAAIESWREIGYEPMVGLEAEAYVFQKDEAGVWVPYDAPGHYVYGTGPQVDPLGLFDELWERAHHVGFNVESINTEFDVAQFEMVLRYDEALRACDDFFLFRTMARDLFFRRGHLLSFMPRPVPKQGGNGMHINLSFRDTDGANALAGGTRPAALSDLTRGCIAGLIAHHEALGGILAPTTNSYERLKPAKTSGYWANWGFDHRSAAVRVSPEDGEGARIEHRLADCAANPHLAVAAVLHAARLGLASGAELPPAERKDGILNVSTDRHVAHSLGESLDHLEADEDLVAAIGRPLIENYVAIKRAEIEELADKSRREVFDYYAPFI